MFVRQFLDAELCSTAIGGCPWPGIAGKATKAFFEKHAARLTVYQLPSYSPDYNPIEKLWKKVKEKGTHLHYFPTFDALKDTVDQALLQFLDAPREVLSLFVKFKELAEAA